MTVVREAPNQVELELDGESLLFAVDRHGSMRYVDAPGGPVTLEEMPRFPSPGVELDPGSLHAPMPGRVIRVEVSVGDRVIEGQTLVVLEAMKMEHTLRAPWPGTAISVEASPGQQVDADAVLVIVEPAST
jgi:propionyl-CoA carboxylase alpha chain